MNKIIIFCLLIFSFNLFAQDEEPIYESEFAETPADLTSDAQAPLALPNSEMEVPVSTQAPTMPEAPVAYTETPSVSTPALITETEVEDSRDFVARKSHWLTSFGFEGLKWEVPWEFSGVNKNFKTGETQELWGGRFGIGREIYLGGGLITTSKVEAYYMGTLFTRALTANPDYKIDYSYSKRVGSFFGVDASQSLGFLFGMKTKNPFMDEWSYLTVEPYIEAGIGRAQAYNKVHYFYDTTGPNPGGTEEEYRDKVNDQITNARIGAGINFTSNRGYFLYLRATQNRYDITSRKQSTLIQQNGSGGVSTDSTQKNVKIDPVMIYALGGGYKF